MRVRDPETGAVLGRCREAFSFLDKEQVPPEVMARRHRDAHTRIEVDSKPEVIMKYEKDVRLDATVIGERYEGHASLERVRVIIDKLGIRRLEEA